MLTPSPPIPGASSNLKGVWWLAVEATARLAPLVEGHPPLVSTGDGERLREALLELVASLRSFSKSPCPNDYLPWQTRDGLAMDAAWNLAETEHADTDVILAVAESAADAVMAAPDDEEAAVQLASLEVAERSGDMEVAMAESATRYLHSRYHQP